MKKKEITIESQAKSGSMRALVEEYTDQLMTHRKRPNPRQFLDRYSNKPRKEGLKAHINVASLLTSLGLAQQKTAQKIRRNSRRMQKAKGKLLNILSKNTGGA